MADRLSALRRGRFLRVVWPSHLRPARSQHNFAARTPKGTNMSHRFTARVGAALLVTLALFIGLVPSAPASAAGPAVVSVTVTITDDAGNVLPSVNPVT